MLISPSRKKLILILGLVSLLPIFAFIFYVFGIVITYTGSVPVGFYRIVSLHHSIQHHDYIAFCLPDRIAKEGMRKHYIMAGRCQNGSEILLKEVIAIPGDRVGMSSFMLTVNNSSYPAPTTVLDKQQKAVKRFIASGHYTAKGYWVYGFNSPLYSWDSRYYGEIPLANVQYRLVPLWIFSHRRDSL